MGISGIRAQGMKIMAILLLFGLVGCAGSYKDLDTVELSDDEGIAIGKVAVIYNGESYNHECQICIQSTCQNLTEEGWVFMRLKQGGALIEELFCSEGISRQNQAFEGAGFEVGAGVTYFGDLTFNWKNENPFTFMNAFATNFVGGAAMQASADARLDGEINMSVEDNMEPTLQVYQQQAGDASGPVGKSISIVGYQAKAAP